MQLKTMARFLMGATACMSGVSVAASPVLVGAERFGADVDTGVHPGLLVYNELKCGACHGVAHPMQGAFPKSVAPVLDQVGERLRFDYLKAFIASPQSIKPGTTMPALFADKSPEEGLEASENLAHFLMSLGGEFQEDPSRPDQAVIDKGAALFHSVGCVACHEPTEAAGAGGGEEGFWDENATVTVPDRTVPSVPFPDFSQKTSAGALAKFLADPLHIRPGGRMPDMSLTEVESQALAAWLVYGDGGTPPPSVTSFDPAKAEMGRALFQTVGCATCHTVEGTQSVVAAKALTGERVAAGGCIAEVATANKPWFDASAAQRAALQAFFDDPTSVADDVADVDRINHTLLALNCYACHERNALGGPEPGRAVYFTETDDQDLGDEGRMPPTLTGVGSKLTPVWLAGILTDGGRVRPYMATRMPHFGEENVLPLVDPLLAVDREAEPLPVNVTGLEHHHRSHYGRELMGTNGLGCVTCHNLNGTKSLGIPAVDLAYVPDRLQPAWFMRYMLDPASLRPGTRMPAFYIDGKSQGSKLFNGDPRKQIEALWVYLREVKEIRLPEGMEDGADYELKPTTHPIMHRTFVEGVGTHAIAVGFPQGIHYVFDALAMRPAALWRGRFIDGESAQADRFTPFVKPLGESVVMLSEGATLAKAVEGPWDGAHLRFTGYRLDGDRIPVFTYQLGAVQVEEALRPTEDGKGFRRKLSFTGAPQTVFLRIGVGEKTGDHGFTINKISITVTAGAPAVAGPEAIGWVLPVAVVETGTTIEQVISW